MSAVGMQALWVSGCVVLCVELYMCVSSELQRVFCFRCLQEDRQHSTFLDALHPTQDHPSPINIVGNYTQRRIDDTRNQLTASEMKLLVACQQTEQATLLGPRTTSETGFMKRQTLKPVFI